MYGFQYVLPHLVQNLNYSYHQTDMFEDIMSGHDLSATAIEQELVDAGAAITDVPFLTNHLADSGVLIANYELWKASNGTAAIETMNSFVQQEIGQFLAFALNGSTTNTQAALNASAAQLLSFAYSAIPNQLEVLTPVSDAFVQVALLQQELNVFLALSAAPLITQAIVPTGMPQPPNSDVVSTSDSLSGMRSSLLSIEAEMSTAASGAATQVEVGLQGIMSDVATLYSELVQPWPSTWWTTKRAPSLASSRQIRSTALHRSCRCWPPSTAR